MVVVEEEEEEEQVLIGWIEIYLEKLKIKKNKKSKIYEYSFLL